MTWPWNSDIRLNTDIGTRLTPQNPKRPYLEFRLGAYIPPANRASQLVQGFWGGLNLALKFSSNNFYTKNLYCSLGHCFEYKSGSTSSNKFIVDIQSAQFPLLNNTLVTYVEAFMAERLTAQTLDLEVRGSFKPGLIHVIFLDKELYSTLSCLYPCVCING